MNREEQLKQYYYQRKLKINAKKFKEWLASNTKGEYKMLGEYKGAGIKVTIKHNKCGHTYLSTPTNFKTGHHCPYCYGNHKRTKAEYQKQLRKKRSDYLLIGDYVNTDTITLFKHKTCGNTFPARPTSIINFKSGCPYCHQYHGEKLIESVLKAYHINYEIQKKFPGLRDKGPLSYDFYLPRLRTLIEYQGGQHYFPVDYYGGEERFIKQQHHDQQKKEYAKKYHYCLIEVPYTEKTFKQIESYLSQYIKLQKKAEQDALIFKPVKSSELTDLMLNYHYLHRKVGAKFAYGLYYQGKLAGMVTYSVPRPSLAQSISNQATKDNTLELSRLYIKDEVSQVFTNVASRFVAWSLHQLRKSGNWFIISFADSGMHHTGAIYQATNFIYQGMTNQDWDIYSGPNRYSEHWQKGKVYRYRVLKTKKYRYLFLVGSKTFKKFARKTLKRKVLPYPKQDNQHYQPGETEVNIVKDMQTGLITKIGGK